MIFQPMDSLSKKTISSSAWSPIWA